MVGFQGSIPRPVHPISLCLIDEKINFFYNYTRRRERDRERGEHVWPGLDKQRRPETASETPDISIPGWTGGQFETSHFTSDVTANFSLGLNNKIRSSIDVDTSFPD